MARQVEGSGWQHWWQDPGAEEQTGRQAGRQEAGELSRQESPERRLNASEDEVADSRI